MRFGLSTRQELRAWSWRSGKLRLRCDEVEVRRTLTRWRTAHVRSRATPSPQSAVLPSPLARLVADCRDRLDFLALPHHTTSRNHLFIPQLAIAMLFALPLSLLGLIAISPFATASPLFPSAPLPLDIDLEASKLHDYPNKVILARHGEKPSHNGVGLSRAGKKRAQCFRNVRRVLPLALF